MGNAVSIQQRLVESGLITSGSLQEQWDRCQSDREGRPPSDAEFLQWLVDKHVLTDFQREALLAGHGVPSFLVGPYRVYELIAVGALGGLFRAVHKMFDQPVSLKLLPAPAQTDEETLGRIRREARVAVELHHPNVVSCFDVGRVNGQYYLAFEDLQGETLTARLERDGYLPFVEACRIGRHLALGLAHLHENGIVLRNLRPDSVWLTSDGAAKIMEFSAALDAFSQLDADQAKPRSLVLEDYTYAAPEQARDPQAADVRSDVYALGAVLYDCLAGRPPFKEENPIRQVVRLLCDEPAPLSQLNRDVPEPFDDTMAGLLAKSLTERFQKAKHVAIALDQYIPEHPPERVVVTDVSPQYLEYLDSVWTKEHGSPSSLPPGASGITPEMTDFVMWLSQLSHRKK
jgi:serine/threonine protein kinase